ncbi:phosphonate ABC transporter, permease protein PhnE [Pseudochelatococcus sp. B33]
MPDPVSTRLRAPSRLGRTTPLQFTLLVAVGGALVFSFYDSGFSVWRFIEGLPNIWRLLTDMFPPDISRLSAVLLRLLETFQMAFVGTFVGVIISLPIAILATRTHSPSSIVYYASRTIVSFFRTIPDLIWALIFVVAVGLGPFAGTLAIIVDTIGFCGRFFAEAMEEADEGPQEALRALGASRLDIIGSAVLPAAMPSMIATSLFSLEKATRSSVVLGIVGAGGIGMELAVAMNLFNYQQALTIILAIFALVLAVEQIGGRLRSRIIAGTA